MSSDDFWDRIQDAREATEPGPPGEFGRRPPTRLQRQEDRQRRWWARYRQLPAGGVVELRAFLQKNVLTRDMQPAFRFDELEAAVVAKAVEDTFDRAGATASEKSRAIEKWHAFAPWTVPLAGLDPDTCELPDPLALHQVRAGLADVESRKVEQRRSAEEYRKRTMAWKGYRRKVVAWWAFILFFALVAVALVGAGIVRHDYEVAASAFFTVIPILLAGGGMTLLREKKPLNPDKPYLGHSISSRD